MFLHVLMEMLLARITEFLLLKLTDAKSFTAYCGREPAFFPCVKLGMYMELGDQRGKESL